MTKRKFLRPASAICDQIS